MKEINNNIKESYCSFEVSKLLKEKGFENEFCQCYTEDREFYISPNLLGERITGKKRPATIPAPTHAVAIEWLRVNLGIWIEIRHINTYKINGFNLIIWKYGEGDYHSIYTKDGGYIVFESPQEATEAALKYVLEELI